MLNLSQAHYYLGEFGLLKGNEKFARQQFEKSRGSGGITLERAMASHWLKQAKQPTAKPSSKPVSKPVKPKAKPQSKSKPQPVSSKQSPARIAKAAKQDKAKAQAQIVSIRKILKAGKVAGEWITNQQRRGAYESLTYLYLQSDDIDSVITWGEMVQNKGVKNPETLVILGVAQMLQGQDKKAIAAFKQCLELPLNEPHTACELWSGIMDHPASANASRQLSSLELRLAKTELKLDDALSDARSLFLYSDLTGFAQLKDKAKRLGKEKTESGLGYRDQMSFYLGMWRLISGDEQAAKAYFRTAAASEQEHMERAFARLWLSR